jgi:hypothetical protein
MDGYEFMRLAETVEPGQLVYDRGWFWVAASVLTWYAFWYVADAHGESPIAQYIAWAAIGLSIWFARNF